MKKGCFIKLIIIVTILVAAALYVIKTHFNDFVVKPGKNFLKELTLKNINEQLAPIKNTPEKDSLKVLINKYVENKINNINFFSGSDQNDEKDVNIDFSFSEPSEKSKIKAQVKLIADSLDLFLKDNLIDKEELLKIKEILEDKINE